MKHPFPADWHDPRLEKLIPFVGPGAALFFLFVVYLIFAVIFK